jgi:hypothetical protein
MLPSQEMWRKRRRLLPRVLISLGEFLPRVDVRSAYEMYFRYFLLWAIAVGLVTKLVYLRYWIRLSWRRCAIVDVVMNATSSLLNLIAVPVAWLVWALPRLSLNRMFGTDDADPVNWIALLLIIAMIGALSEAFVLHFALKQRLGQKGFCLLYLVNAVCIGTAACGMGFHTVAHPPIA